MAVTIKSTIDKPSQISLSYSKPCRIGTTPITVKISSQSSSYTHTLSYQLFGETTWIASGVKGSYVWTPPESLASKFTSAQWSRCLIICNTYKGEQRIGSSSVYVDLYLDPEKTAPTLTDWTISEGNPAVQQIGLSDSEYIDKNSIINVSVTGIQSGLGGTYKQMTLIIGNISVATTSKTNISINKASMGVSGEVDVFLVLWDNRSLSRIYTKKITIYPYERPIDKTTVLRYNNYENQTIIAPNVEISEFGGKIFKKDYKYRVYQKNGSPPSYTSITNLTLSKGVLTAPNITLDLDNTKEWQVDFVFSDGFSTENKSLIVSRGIPMFFMNSDTGDFEVYGDIYSHGQKISDFIVEEGMKNGWYCIIRKSGIKECWTRGTKSGINMTVNHYSGYYYSEPISINLPFTFSSVQYVNVSGGSTNLINSLKELNTSGYSCSFWVYGLSDTATNITIRYNIHVIGK